MADNSDLISLETSIEPFRRWFAAHDGEPRFVALLSPT
jgi:hypothetical protein